MATNVEQTIGLIAQGLEDEARANLIRNGSVRTGNLLRSTEVFVRNGDDFVATFLDYGVFVDQGTEFQRAEPFYSELVVAGDVEGSYEDEITEMLEEAFDQDVEQLDNDFNNLID